MVVLNHCQVKLKPISMTPGLAFCSRSNNSLTIQELPTRIRTSEQQSATGPTPETLATTTCLLDESELGKVCGVRASGRGTEMEGGHRGGGSSQGRKECEK